MAVKITDLSLDSDTNTIEYRHKLIEFRSTNPKHKAYIQIGKTINGVFWLQFQEAKGYRASYIHQNAKGFYTEDGIYMPKYVMPLIKAANKFIDNLYYSWGK